MFCTFIFYNNDRDKTTTTWPSQLYTVRENCQWQLYGLTIFHKKYLWFKYSRSTSFSIC